MRSFEVARKMENGEPVSYEQDRCLAGTYEPAFASTKLPEYATKHSAGADFFCAEEVTIPSIWGIIFTSLGNKAEDKASKAFDSIMAGLGYTRKEAKAVEEKHDIAPTLVHTGIKANMEDDEVLELYNRSSNPKKLGLVLANGVGVVDSDYYENKDNDGEIMFAFYNFKPWAVTLKVGDKIGQGVFKKYFRPTVGLVVNDESRNGGFGSTDKDKE